jgi:hypothetical protein
MDGKTCARHRWWRAVGLAGLAAAGLLVVACGGGPHSAGSGASPAQGRVQQLDVFAKCMRSHGLLNFYFTPKTNASNSADSELSIMGYYVPGVDPQTPPFPAAMKACKHLLPGGGPGPMTQQQINRLVKFAACMRAHGYPEYPDPQVQNGVPIGQPLPASIDTSSPQFEAAQQTCNSAS